VLGVFPFFTFRVSLCHVSSSLSLSLSLYIFLSLFCLCCPCFASLCLSVFAQECKRVSVGDFDESLFSLIQLPFSAILEGFLMLNYLLLAHFP